jgi:NADPH2:quinone reductase
VTQPAELRPQMRAAVVEEINGTPVVGSVDRPVPDEGQVLIKVSAAGLNPHDLVTAAGIRAVPPVPYVTGNEGVGFLEDGTRVYFGPVHLPNGSMGEYAVIAEELATPIPAGLSDADALGLGVAGTTAWLAMTWKARLQPGESVLVMGATGAVGQIAVQAAKLLGASRVVAAGRQVEVLQTLLERGADEVVVLDEGYEQRLIDASQGGFDLVVDSLFAAPMQAALFATKYGGRLVNLGMRAGRLMELSGIAVKGRDLLSYNGDLPPAAAHREAFERMTAHVLAGELIVESETLPIEDIASAWKRQAESPNKKLVITP